MFGSKNKQGSFSTNKHTVFDHTLEIEGNIKFAGELYIEGKVTGSVYADDSTNAQVTVHEKGQVFGEISAPRVTINGTINGDVYCSKHLELLAKAVVNGNVHYKVMEMVKGAEVNGSLIHIVEHEEQKKPKTEVASVTNRQPDQTK